MKKRARKKKGVDRYLAVSGEIFLATGLAHLLRVIMGWTVMVENQVVPLWMSAVAVVVTWVLGAELLKRGCG